MNQNELGGNHLLGYLLYSAHRSLTNRLNKNFKLHGFNITKEQYVVIRHLWHEDKINQQRIADLTGKEKFSITKLIDGLEKKKLVKRFKKKDDRRVNLIRLTPEGKLIKEDLMKIVDITFKEATLDITTENKQFCEDILQKITDNLE